MGVCGAHYALYDESYLQHAYHSWKVISATVREGEEPQQLILTLIPNAMIDYVRNVDNEADFPSDFTMALTHLLASYLAGTLRPGTPEAVKQLALYNQSITRAQANAANEQGPRTQPVADYIRNR